MKDITVKDQRFARYVLANAELEQLAALPLDRETGLDGALGLPPVPRSAVPQHDHVPHVVADVTFGGPAKNRLFIVGSGTLYAIFLNTRGIQWP